MELSLSGSRGLACGWVLWCLALALGLWLGCALPAGWRLGLVAVVALAGWRGYLRLRRPEEGRSLRWEADGRWRVEGGSGPGAYVQPGRLRRLGRVVWIGWPGNGTTGRYFHADGVLVEPKALAALKGRVKFAGPSRRRSSP